MLKLVAIALMAWSTNTLALSDELPDYLLPAEKNQIRVFNKVSPSVVHVSNIRLQRTSFFSRDVIAVPGGSGSGFFWDQKGHIVTNFHVVQKSSRVYVSLKDGKEIEAKVIGSAPRKDIAVLKIELPRGESVGPMQLADSNKVMVGQQAITIGSPFGLDQTMTVGVVSALGRSVPGVGNVTIRDMIQTDAAINPGNSGGPLLDSRGHLLGMNTAIYSESGNSAGVGFAVPSNTIKRLVTQLILSGRVIQPGIGITVIPEHIVRRSRLDGVIIMEAAVGGPAARSGLRGTDRKANGEMEWGDRIVGIDGESINTFDDLYNVLSEYDVGKKVKVVFYRGRSKKTVSVELIDIGR